MRRRKKDGFDEWIALPWQASAIAGVVAFVALSWIAPSLLGGTLGRALAPLLVLFGWVALFGFALIAVASFMRAERTAAVAPKRQRERPSQPRPLSDESSNAEEEQEFRQAATERRASLEARPADWSMNVLQRMDWKRFEYLAAAYYERIGFRTKPIGWGADNGIDVLLFRGDLPEPVSVVQCKAWNDKPVGVKEMRELLGVMTASKVKAGVFLTTSTFTSAAVDLAEANYIAPVAGTEFLTKIGALSEEQRQELLAVACEGDWTTPSCPKCAVKLLIRESKHGRFWGCKNFPKCTYKLNSSRISGNDNTWPSF